MMIATESLPPTMTEMIASFKTSFERPCLKIQILLKDLNEDNKDAIKDIYFSIAQVVQGSQTASIAKYYIIFGNYMGVSTRTSPGKQEKSYENPEASLKLTTYPEYFRP